MADNCIEGSSNGGVNHETRETMAREPRFRVTPKHLKVGEWQACAHTTVRQARSAQTTNMATTSLSTTNTEVKPTMATLTTIIMVNPKLPFENAPHLWDGGHVFMQFRH